MHNLWLVAKHEYAKVVKKKSFLLGTLGIPVLIVLVTVVGIFVVLGQRGKLPLGYVDQAGVLSESVNPYRENGEAMVEMQSYEDIETARAALYAEEIQAYYVVPSDYLASGRVELFYLTKRPGEMVRGDFADFLRANLLAGQTETVRRRIQQGPALTIHSMDGKREFKTENILNFLLPYAAAFFFIFGVMGSGSYMLQAVTDEKENRTIEILTTSLRPIELIGGKALGLMSVGLTQMGIWSGTAVLGLVIAMLFIDIGQNFTVPWSLLVVIAMFFLPAYALIAALMTAVGSAVTDLRQGQQISGIFNLLFTFPFFFLALIMAKPNSPISIILTLFPTTAFVTITMRWAITTVPLWQVMTSWVLVVSTATFAVWAASRIFRMGMLRYGQQLTFKNILASLRRTK